jgi:hypothetical protein
MRYITKDKRECHFTVTTKVFLLFKSVCSVNGVKMNKVIEQLMMDYIGTQKNNPPE